jgi:hypothetical protein
MLTVQSSIRNTLTTVVVILTRPHGPLSTGISIGHLAYQVHQSLLFVSRVQLERGLGLQLGHDSHEVDEEVSTLFIFC